MVDFLLNVASILDPVLSWHAKDRVDVAWHGLKACSSPHVLQE